MISRRMMLNVVVVLGACAPGDQAQVPQPAQQAGSGLEVMDAAANGHRFFPRGNSNNTAAALKSSGTGIYYHGGPLILGTAHVYYIWYGNWLNNTATSILPDFAQNIGGSPYFNINTTYYDGGGNRVSNSVILAGSATNNYTYGSSLSQSNVLSIVSDAITSGQLPSDASGVYDVLTSADVKLSGFCSNYCGWHTHASIGGVDIKYGFIGDPDQCPSACEAQTTSPNGNAGADGMANIIAHELDESVTDPDLTAWYDRRGYENADKCAWTFGTTYTTSNGSLANLTLGTRDYLIQQNWKNAGNGGCVLKF